MYLNLKTPETTKKHFHALMASLVSPFYLFIFFYMVYGIREILFLKCLFKSLLNTLHIIFFLFFCFLAVWLLNPNVLYLGCFITRSCDLWMREYGSISYLMRFQLRVSMSVCEIWNVLSEFHISLVPFALENMGLYSPIIHFNERREGNQEILGMVLRLPRGKKNGTETTGY